MEVGAMKVEIKWAVLRQQTGPYGWLLANFLVDGVDQDLTAEDSIDEASLTNLLYLAMYYLMFDYKVTQLHVQSLGYVNHMRRIMGDNALTGGIDIEDWTLDLNMLSFFKRRRFVVTDEDD
jgi:hypothetical protein